MARESKFVVCRTLPEILRLSRGQIDKIGTEFSLCDCYYCGQSLIISVDDASNAATMRKHIVCPKCAEPDAIFDPCTMFLN